MDATILRIYMPLKAQRKGNLTFWQKLFSSSLGGFLLKEAKTFGIEQAIYQRALGGYLKGNKLVFDQAEVVPSNLPQVVELLDQEERLRAFVEKYRDQFKDSRVILLKSTELLT